MIKKINGIIYTLLLVVVMFGVAGTVKYIKLEVDPVPQSIVFGMVRVHKLPVFENEPAEGKEIEKPMKILSYGNTVGVLQEGILYTRVRIDTQTEGYVWSSCIGKVSGSGEKKVMVIDSGKTRLAVNVAQKVGKKLEESDYTVVMTGNSDNIAVSNAQGAELANQIKADALIHIDTYNGRNQTVSGSAIYYTSKASSPYEAKCYEESRKLAKALRKAYTDQTGTASRGTIEAKQKTILNECERPAVILEIGCESCKKEYKKMQDMKYQEDMVNGIVEGIQLYFSKPKV